MQRRYMKIAFLVFLCSQFVPGSRLVAQQRQQYASDEQGETTASGDGDSLNKKDSRNRKQGTWFSKVAPLRGEPGYMYFGNYLDNERQGAWYKLDVEGRLVSIEHFKKGILDGQSQFYEKGKLICIGQYRGFDGRRNLDSVWVTDPITLLDTLVAVSNYQGALKHGMWRYYDPVTGQLVKEEEYQVDDLIHERTFQHTSTTDSVRMEQRKEQLPHNKKSYYKPPTGKGKAQSY